MSRYIEKKLREISQNKTSVSDVWIARNNAQKTFGHMMTDCCGVYGNALFGALLVLESDFCNFKRAVSTDYRAERIFDAAFDEFFRWLSVSAPFLCIPEAREKIIRAVQRWQRGDY